MEISQLEARIFLQIMLLNSTMEYNHGNRVNCVTQCSHLSWSRLDRSAACIRVVSLVFYYYSIIFCKRFVNLRLLPGSQFTVRSVCNKTVTNRLNCTPFNEQKHILLVRLQNLVTSVLFGIFIRIRGYYCRKACC